MSNKNISYAKVIITVALVLCAYVYVGCAAENIKDQYKELYEQVELFSDAVSIIQTDYVEEVKPQKLVYGALEGMLSSLDPNSQFMDPETYKEMEVDTMGEFGGLGIEIGIKDDILTIIAPIDGTPAEKAGLKSGDKIAKIEGEPTRNMSLSDAVKKLRGKPKTSVSLAILREGQVIRHRFPGSLIILISMMPEGWAFQIKRNCYHIRRFFLNDLFYHGNNAEYGVCRKPL